MMGKRTSLRPFYTRDIASLIAADVHVRALCDTCDGFRSVDLVALAAIKGADYDLWGKRTRCRLTTGCQGWNRFYFNGRGRFEPMRG